MYLFKIWQNVNTGYDTYDEAVVAAFSLDRAKLIHPNGDEEYNFLEDGTERDKRARFYRSWASNASEVHAELIGAAVPGTKEGVIVASFNAG